MGLPSVLALACLLACIVFVLLGTTLSSHGLIGKLEQKARGRLLAEAALKRCLLKLRNEPNFGSQASDGLTVTLPGNPEGWRGEIRFGGLGASCNNLAGATSVPFEGGLTVPAHCALLIGHGILGAASTRVQVLLRRSEFPFVLASQGPFVSAGATRVGVLPEEGDGHLRPGDLASNSAVEQAVELGPESFVSGDLRAVGGVLLAPQARVAGQTLPHSAQVELPRIDLRRFDPLLSACAYQDLPVLTGDLSLAAVGRCSSDMTVQGHLTLQGAQLFVDGNLTVTRGISGSGLLVVTGETRVIQGARLEASDQAVLLSKGRVTLTGVGAGSSQFHGLVYTEGGLTAEQISLTGTFISNGSDAPTRIQDVQLSYDPNVTHLNRRPGSGSWLIPGSPGNRNARSDSFEDYKYRDKAAAGAWVSAPEGALTPTTEELFNLNDFLGQGQPMEVLLWREIP